MTATKNNPLALAAFSELVRRLERRGHKITGRTAPDCLVLELPAPDGVHGECYGELEYCLALNGWNVSVEAGDHEMVWSLTTDRLTARVDRLIHRARRTQYR